VIRSSGSVILSDEGEARRTNETNVDNDMINSDEEQREVVTALSHDVVYFVIDLLPSLSRKLRSSLYQRNHRLVIIYDVS
jgi:hypothetical protein